MVHGEGTEGSTGCALVGTHQSTGLNNMNVIMIKTITMNNKCKFFLFQEPLYSQNIPGYPVSLICFHANYDC